jgi:hypothetical protein
MESSPTEEKGFKRTESGLWLPDLESRGLKSLVDEGVALDQLIDPAEHANKKCKYCHGKGEMRVLDRPGTKGSPSHWTLCMCVVAAFPPGEKNTEILKETERVKVRPKSEKSRQIIIPEPAGQTEKEAADEEE